MDVVDAIISFMDSVSNWFGLLINRMNYFIGQVGDVLTYVWSIIETIYFSLTTLLSNMLDLINQVFSSGVF